MVDNCDVSVNKGSTFVKFFGGAVSSVGRASRLHRLSPSLIPLANPTFILNTTLVVTLTSHLVTKTKGKRHEYNKKARSEMAIHCPHTWTPKSC